MFKISREIFEGLHKRYIESIKDRRDEMLDDKNKHDLDKQIQVLENFAAAYLHYLKNWEQYYKLYPSKEDFKAEVGE